MGLIRLGQCRGWRLEGSMSRMLCMERHMPLVATLEHSYAP